MYVDLCILGIWWWKSECLQIPCLHHDFLCLHSMTFKDWQMKTTFHDISRLPKHLWDTDRLPSTPGWNEARTHHTILKKSLKWWGKPLSRASLSSRITESILSDSQNIQISYESQLISLSYTIIAALLVKFDSHNWNTNKILLLYQKYEKQKPLNKWKKNEKFLWF